MPSFTIQLQPLGAKPNASCGRVCTLMNTNYCCSEVSVNFSIHLFTQIELVILFFVVIASTWIAKHETLTNMQTMPVALAACVLLA